MRRLERVWVTLKQMSMKTSSRSRYSSTLAKNEPLARQVYKVEQAPSQEEHRQEAGLREGLSEEEAK